jgi:hypothetical protein
MMYKGTFEKSKLMFDLCNQQIPKLSQI